jgi:iron complex outermembrane receptor protein
MKKLLLILLTLQSFLSYSQDSIKVNLLESVQIIGIKPIKKEPVTLTTIGIDSIRHTFQGNDPFFVMNRWSPSILSQSDGGLPIGYSYLRMRGLDQTRINFTLNGIPLNEMEDQGIYFSNMPDFMANISEIQIQRGIGTSKYGTTSFAGSVNLETKSLLKKEVSGEVGFGSFNTFRASTGFTTGLIRDKISFSSRFSYLKSDGFRQNSGTEGFTYFGQAGYFGKKDIVKVYGFTGKSKNQMAWWAPNDSMIRNDYRLNLNTPEEKDLFGQNFVALNWVNFGLKSVKFNSSVYFNNINGRYTAYLDPSTLGLFSLNSYQTGAMTNIVYEKNDFTITGGLNYNYYQRSHSLADNVLPNELFYRNVGYKQDVVALFKLNRDFSGFNLFMDLQYRWVNFNYNKELNWTWNFFNPKFGAKYIGKNWTTYVSFATTGREVTRTDLLRGYDNVTVFGNNVESFGDTFVVNPLPERCYNSELGGTFKWRGLNLSGNFYVMYFNNERIPTGQINYIGLTLKNPVNESIRYGFEFDGSYFYKGLTMGTNLSVSKSKIYSWKELDVNGKETGNTYQNTEAFASPRFLMNNYIQYRHKYFLIGLNGQYVSSMFLDNRQDQFLTTPSYYILGAQVGGMWEEVSITINVNNITNQKFFLPGGVLLNRPAYYVGALTNFFLTLKVNL